MSLVRGKGNPEGRILLLGEKPGHEELNRGYVWCGRAGDELSHLMWKWGVPPSECWFDNLLSDAPTGDDWSVTDEDLNRNAGHIAELLGRDWDVVVSLGAVSTRHLLGSGVRADIGTVHAIPHSLPDRTFTVFPTFHPAAGLHDSEAYPYLAYDFQLLSGYLRGHTDRFPDRVDLFDRPRYTPLTDRDAAFIRHYFERRLPTDLYIDTEGSVGSPWCLSWTDEEGTGFVIRAGQWGAIAEFWGCILKYRPWIWFHYAVHDIPVCRALGLPFVEHDLEIFDTMVMAYLLQVEPQGLKNLAYRHCGMEMSDYLDLVGPYDLEKRLEYLIKLTEVDWGKPAEILIEDKKGSRMSQPQSLNTRVWKILEDINKYEETIAANPAALLEPVDIWKRWNSIIPEVRARAEEQYGALPHGDLDDLPFEEAMHYASRDADATCRVRHALEPRLHELGLWGTFLMDCATIPMVEEMQTTGIVANQEYFGKLRDGWRGAQGRVRKKLFDMTGKWINCESDPQVRKLLFEDLKLPSIKKTEGGQASTNDKAIDWMKTDTRIPAEKREIVRLVGESREYEKSCSSFADPIIEFAKQDPESAVHTNLKYTRVVSGRFSATEPNLLAMPVRSEQGKQIRGGFEARPGKKLGSWDLNQIEMRYMAHESEDPDLISAYQRGADIHKETASRMFGCRIEDVTDEQREVAKRVSFGVITGITGMGLKDQFWLNGITKYDEDDCDKFIETWFEARPLVKAYLEACRCEARMNGYVRESIGGRIRYMQAVHSTNKKMVAEHERASHSHRISSGAQAILKKGMAALWPIINTMRRDDGVYIKWLLQVHDELIFEFDDGLEVVLDPIITDVLCSTVRLRVPIKAKGKWAYNWGKLK